MQVAENYEHAGVEVSLFHDIDGGDPRDADNLGEMYAYYRGHELGDHPLPPDGLPAIPCPQCRNRQPASGNCERCDGWGEVSPNVGEWLRSMNALAAMPLFVYDHGVLTVRGGRLVMLGEDCVHRTDTATVDRFPADAQGWDTSFVGFMVVTEERIQTLCGEDPEHREADWLDSALKTELAEYDRYLRGEVYSYVVAGGTSFEESCGGFIGLEYAKEEADRAAEGAATLLRDEQVARAEWAARDVITVSGG